MSKLSDRDTNKLILKEDFSIMTMGPIYRLQLRLGLLKPGAPNTTRRALVSILLSWIPLLILSAIQGLAIGNQVKIPFLADFAVYTRFLLAIPILILAEKSIGRRIAEAVSHFADAGLIPKQNKANYECLLQRIKDLCDSSIAEFLLIGLAALSILAARNEFPFDFSTWRSLVSDSTHTRTLAGWWNLIVSMGLFEFLLWRCLWRLFIWYWFLWRVSKLDLQLIPTHPDLSAGLGFICEAHRYFAWIVLAFSTGIAGALADEVVYAGVPLVSYKISIGAYLVMVLLVSLGPLLMFMPLLIEAKIRGIHQYNTLVVTHNRMFDGKWVQNDNPEGEVVLGTPDISSLADLGSAFEVLKSMRSVLFERKDVLFFIAVALMPMTPLLLTVIPTEKIFELLGKALL
jgi:hypothetical protein